MSDINFEQMLAQFNQDYREAEVFNDRMPDDGKYIISLIKLDTGTAKEGGAPWMKLRGRIEDPQDATWGGFEFPVGFYSAKAFGILKGAVNVLAGKSVNDLAEAYEVLKASLGKIIEGEVKTTTSAKNGKDYTNCYILKVIDEVASADAQQAEAPAQDPAIVDPATDVNDIPFTGDGDASVGDTNPTEVG